MAACCFQFSMPSDLTLTILSALWHIAFFYLESKTIPSSYSFQFDSFLNICIKNRKGIHMAKTLRIPCDLARNKNISRLQKHNVTLLLYVLYVFYAYIYIILLSVIKYSITQFEEFADYLPL